MHTDPRLVLRQTFGLRGPDWAVEHDLISMALDGHLGARRLLRRSREYAATQAPPIVQPTLTELRAAIDGTTEERVDMLVRLYLHEVTQGDASLADARLSPRGAGRGPQTTRRTPR